LLQHLLHGRVLQIWGVAVFAKETLHQHPHPCTSRLAVHPISAKRLAWENLANEWHKKHGRRWPTWQCAGCGEPLAGREAISLPDGNRVHTEPINCMIDFGRRWRNEAKTALISLGVTR
jgi:hypothetical protein